jgi:hypothetical protein
LAGSGLLRRAERDNCSRIFGLSRKDTRSQAGSLATGKKKSADKAGYHGFHPRLLKSSAPSGRQIRLKFVTEFSKQNPIFKHPVTAQHFAVYASDSHPYCCFPGKNLEKVSLIPEPKFLKSRLT